MFKTKWLKVSLFVLLTFALLGGAGLVYLKYSRAAVAVSFRRSLGEFLHMRAFPAPPDPEEGLAGAITTTFYIDGVISDPGKADKKCDTKLVLETADKTRLFDYTMGCSADFPVHTSFDFSHAQKYVTASGDGFKATISKEWSTEKDVDFYIDYYLNRFITDESFQTNNNVSLVSSEENEKYELLTLKINRPARTDFDTYGYLIFKTDSRFFFRIMVKFDSEINDMNQITKNLADSFKYFKSSGKAVNNVDFYPVPDPSWSGETRALFEEICGYTNVKWGIFSKNIYEEGINETIPAIEETIDYKFDVILAYVQLNDPFPLEFMQERYKEGRLVELTYQLTSSNNLDLYATSPSLKIYTGRDYKQIREFARRAKEFSHPFLFRLNNEMNSDWVSYGGINNMMDGDIYIDVWQTIYKIFKEEGVDNAIWIFNPNDRDYPPNSFNSFLSFYPGNEYVHMLGVTGYNNGTYYANDTGETWREFPEIYDNIVAEYGGMFDRFPWIITEFASSSIGGDKPGWISGMFDSLNSYPNIKIAVWFSYADFDLRKGKKEAVSRPYWLDETDECLKAFKNGLKKSRV